MVEVGREMNGKSLSPHRSERADFVYRQFVD